jgi:hypothetical protein
VEDEGSGRGWPERQVPAAAFLDTPAPAPGGPGFASLASPESPSSSLIPSSGPWAGPHIPPSPLMQSGECEVSPGAIAYGPHIAQFHLYETRGPVHEFVHRWGPSAWLAIGASQEGWPAGGRDRGRLASWLWEVGCGSALTTRGSSCIEHLPTGGQCMS